jgi:hypothetical protein
MNANVQPTADAALPVSIFGVDAEGKPFFQFAIAQQFNEQGALIEGVEHPLKPGEVIGVQYKDQKTRARIIWVCEMQNGPAMRAGVQLITPEKCPWEQLIPPVAKEERRLERRRYRRYEISIGLELWNPATGVKAHAQSSDISACGCYIESMLPLAAGTPLRIGMWLNGSKFEVAAVVRTSHPGVGMGIEFTDLTLQQQTYLSQLINGCRERLG